MRLGESALDTLRFHHSFARRPTREPGKGDLWARFNRARTHSARSCPNEHYRRVVAAADPRCVPSCDSSKEAEGAATSRFATGRKTSGKGEGPDVRCPALLPGGCR
jgi:hypothetical protein